MSNGAAALECNATGDGVGLYGTSQTGSGVAGLGAPGVSGFCNTPGSNGVLGDVGAAENANGVYGHAQNSVASGVYGQNDGTGFGVAGRAINGTGVLGDSQNGIGVAAHTVTGTALQAAADSSSGVALQVAGRAVFSLSGLATVKPGSTSVTVHLAGVTGTSLVLATLHQQAGQVVVASAVPGSGSFTIHLTKAPASRMKVAYLVLG